MSHTRNREEELAAEITRLKQERPYLDNLFTSFGPMLLLRERWMKDKRKEGTTISVDPLQYSGGITLIQQCRDLLDDDRWHDAGLAAAGAIGSGFRELAGDMDFLADRIRGGLDCYAVYRSAIDLKPEELQRKARETGVQELSLAVFLRCIGRLMLGIKAAEMATELASLSWAKGYCPVCGSFPHLAIIRDKGQRWLQCPQCNHEWGFPRMTCPYCEHEDPENSGFLFVEGKKGEMAFTCSKCQKYLITIDQSGNLRSTSADLLAISLAHLDILVQEKGLEPMAQCEWNTYQKPE
ncbi:MAG: formate dehydrogenase accessory protein FdhE [Desulfoprunum sp.]|jgi:FdhE protein